MEEVKTEEENKKRSFKDIINNINNMVTGDVLTNLAYSSMIMLYFMFFNLQYELVSNEMLIKYINISSIIFLFISIFMIEISYKNENESILLYGLEFFVLAIFTLLIKHVPKLSLFNLQTYVLVGSYLFAIYYMFKSTVLYTIEKQKQLNEFSDIKEIVKDEPIKKKSKRKNSKKKEEKND